MKKRNRKEREKRNKKREERVVEKRGKEKVSKKSHRKEDCDQKKSRRKWATKEWIDPGAAYAQHSLKQERSNNMDYQLVCL